MNNKIIISALCFFLTFAAFIQADEASHKKAANDLLVAMDIQKMLEKSNERMVTLQLARNKKIIGYENVLNDFYNKYSNWDIVKDDVIKMYTEKFTEAELNELTKFYKSPVGQKALAEIPTLMLETIAAGQKNIQKNLPELQKQIQKLQEEKKKE
ncbi:MAG: DUF2059 domain-containing protein [Candidatus Dadabacteria bacterium]|nr:DUF2059 domain-containing protein [Candidatus Dadabacteria bacterium]NIS10246.1 DUF2059 domain-containing protein [Candidatus Dadabacteria bacterium]NIV42996.1 DUF2059 domain-containing protein [Candidatus Dadabacteria bacterium]NIX16621.1 DUF2059 domain-containing protein [Candidatus Dadabacteria bacterium]NIY23162.1 DUF2059 domain-containing protein [Candidatus Dadabacteria bacterium]